MAAFWQGLDSAEKLYIVVMLAFIPVLLLGIIASIKVNTTFNKYSRVPSSAGLTAKEAAARMLSENNASHVAIQHIGGKLTDHFDPRTNTIGLSDSTYSSSSIAAIGVACHEAGHALQHDGGYMFSRIRIKLVPVVNFASRLYMPLVLIGIVLGFLSSDPLIGNIIVYAGLIMFGMAALFALITLPTEFNASARAMRNLRSSGSYTSKELSGARKVLTAAAMTYVAAFLMSLVQFLRFVAILLMNMNRRKR